MPSDSHKPQSQTHHHSHGHDHSHVAGVGHGPQQVTDLKSPVLIGVLQRLLWIGVILVGLWSVVFWALRTHG